MSHDSPPLGLAELRVVPIFPLPGAVLFPSTSIPLHVFEPRYRQMITDVLAGDRVLGVVRLKEGYEASYEGRPPVCSVLGVGRVTREVRLPDGRYNILVQGLVRAKILGEHPPLQAYRTVRAEQVEDVRAQDSVALAAVERQVAMLWSRLGPHLPEPVRSLRKLLADADTAGARANRLGDVILVDPDDRQAFLEEPDPSQRFCVLLERLYDLSRALSIDPSTGLN